MTIHDIGPAYVVDYPEWAPPPPPPIVAPEKKPNRAAKVALVTLASWAAAATLVAAGAYGARTLGAAAPAAAPAPVITTEVVTLPPRDTASEFLAALNRVGLVAVDPVPAIHNGYLVCLKISAGMTEDAVVEDVIANSETIGVPKAKAASFVHIAIAHFCPAGHR